MTRNHAFEALLAGTADRPVKVRQAVVSAVTSGSCTLRIGGSTVDVPGVPRLTSYTPSVNDVVMVLVMSPASMLILGTIHA